MMFESIQEVLIIQWILISIKNLHNSFNVISFLVLILPSMLIHMIRIQFT